MPSAVAISLAGISLLTGGISVSEVSKKPARPKPQVIKLVSRATPINNLVDTGPSGLSPGDLYVFSDKLYRADGGGDPLGYVDGSCTVIDPVGLRSVCTFGVVLAKGELTTAGSTSLAPGSVAIGPITGGTGAYLRARGVGRVLLGTNEHKVTLTVYTD